MPSINDLKNDGKAKEPFIPGIVQGDDDNEQFVPSIEVDDSTSAATAASKKKGSVLSMTSGKAREKADFSTLPEAQPNGVTIKESLEQDILGPGGPFEEYMNKMENDAKNFFAEEDMEKDIADAEEDTKAEESTESAKDLSDDELDTEEIEKEYEVSKSEVTYKNIDIFSDTESTTEDDMDEIFEEVKEDEIEEQVEVVKEPEFTEPVEEVEIKRELIKNEVTDDDTDIDLDDEAEVSDDDITEEDANRYLEIIRSEVTKKIKPVSKKMDISSFQVVKKPTMSNTIFEPKEVPVAKWALPITGVTYQIKEILGSDIEKIRSAISSNQISTVLQIVYDHIVSPKPATMEAWAKTIAYDDFDHLFMGVYIASFADSNYIQMVCDNNDCKDKVFVTDNVPIMDMVKFKDADAERKFKALLNSDATNPKGLYTTEVIPISEKFAFAFVIPSIYSVYIEDRYLDNDFRTKYANATSIAPYIDNIYLIDQENSQLVPIGYKEYPNNKAKTAKSKIVKYDKIISSLEVDEMNLIRAYMAKIIEPENNISYIVPAATCPHCGKEIAETASSASQLVFQRNQLSLLVNI